MRAKWGSQRAIKAVPSFGGVQQLKLLQRPKLLHRPAVKTMCQTDQSPLQTAAKREAQQQILAMLWDKQRKMELQKRNHIKLLVPYRMGPASQQLRSKGVQQLLSRMAGTPAVHRRALLRDP